MAESKKILFIEDDAFIAGMVSARLVERGYLSTNITSGEKAITELKKDIPALVILDLFLPGQSGFEVLEAMRADPRTDKVPVLVVSNTDQANDRERVTKLGAQFLLKSLVTPAEIVERVEEMLSKKIA